ncbi:phosphate/phosphite/phosphonate ABC transporter substrate-binding protein [Desulfatitalea alkaliphila]|uniref:Phosphate/phosphite/phosphonate ABC transporter substrate-binding protein n=1 Tax=Desulfatitalea alkaliphila TaxID=2929485 RepID=A0AA41R329_9BACT|nr:phosphate/phosphite/phosphonate ABC transporter substrate-binding protein [Desulfatitalea alkaliphila]MCJ8500841.1 phosphate/phosphite/phosphonate ABC transporter substrate-binding protein [Desulfatitalea alkaliphila]
MHWRHILLLLCCFVLLPIAGCGDQPAPLKVDLSEREKVSPGSHQPVITYAYLPQFSHTVSFERHQRLVRYLSEATGLNIQQVFPETFHEHMLMLDQGKIDISYANPFVYSMTAEQSGARVFAKIIEVTGEAAFGGLIITRRDNPDIQTIADCRGKRWIAVDRFSAGGYLFGLGTFLDHGLRPEDFSQIVFAPGPGGKQESVILGIYAGRYDVGTVREGALELLADRIDLAQIRILARTPRYPGWNYAARPGLAKEVVDAVRAAMFALDYENPAHREILEKAALRGIIAAKPEDFDAVRDLIRRAGLH